MAPAKQIHPLFHFPPRSRSEIHPPGGFEPKGGVRRVGQANGES